MSKNDHSPMRELRGQLLLAMPAMGDPRFARTVILVCSCGENGAMGLVLNRPVAAPDFASILAELEMEAELEKYVERGDTIDVHEGGPVEQGRGFLLHSLDFGVANAHKVNDHVALSATIEALRRVAAGMGPKKFRLLLGYAGWSAGQLESEILDNAWLTARAAPELLFDTPPETLYEAGLKQMGIDEAALSALSGTA